ncbi:MAG: prolipoprotein diacylglyceryl transferase [Flavobacteriales bacterium]|nr:prolipoprotein diacylglyceryl transferase [Flavobacteriales bacterium]
MHQFLHLVFEVAAFALAFAYYQLVRVRQGDAIGDPQRMSIIIAAAVGAFLGSRILGALERPDLLEWNMGALFGALGNRTIVGGLLGGLMAVELTKRAMDVTTSSGDLFTYPLILGILIGRVGCLLGGLEDNTYGVATDLPWGIDLGDGIRRHPTNLYEMLWLAFTWVILVRIERRFELLNGARFKLFMVMYLLFRLIVEIIKPQPMVFMGVSSIQWACLLGLAYYYKVFIFPKRSLIHA